MRFGMIVRSLRLPVTEYPLNVPLVLRKHVPDIGWIHMRAVVSLGESIFVVEERSGRIGD